MVNPLMFTADCVGRRWGPVGGWSLGVIALEVICLTTVSHCVMLPVYQETSNFVLLSPSMTPALQRVTRGLNMLKPQAKQNIFFKSWISDSRKADKYMFSFKKNP